MTAIRFRRPARVSTHPSAAISAATKLAFSLVAAVLLASVPAFAQAPPGYYSSANGLTGTALRNALHNIIDNHTVLPYSSSTQFDTRDAINWIHENPSNSSQVILVYSGFSVPKSSWPDYNREHIWPQSLGTDSGPPNSDVFALFPCDADVNSQRSNLFFDDCFSGCDIPSEAPLCRYDDNSWEPRDSEKGDLARVLFYMDVRYEGDSGEPDLVLQDAASSFGCDCMASLETLLEWHGQDPPDATEIARNNLIYSSIQGNRNPFIDHPDFVYDIWGGGPPDPPSASEVWINEIHYDNGGSDTNEGIELAGPAGTSLNGWKLVGYNGSSGQTYDEVIISGVTIDNESQNYGAVWIAFPGLQNGSPDAVALIDSAGAVREFLGYEGVLVATNGPAAGLTSVDILVQEDGLTGSDESLQRVGLGDESTDFDWTGPTSNSRGSLNVGQSIIGPPGTGFVRGDCNEDGFVGIGDALSILNYLFASGPAVCLEACDPSDDDNIQINDPLTLLNYLFDGGSPPVAPFPSCGDDLTGAADLGCASYTSCP